jgi:hypothetical protein
VSASLPRPRARVAPAPRAARRRHSPHPPLRHCLPQGFDQEKRQHTFGNSAGDRSGFTTDCRCFRPATYYGEYPK